MIGRWGSLLVLALVLGAAEPVLAHAPVKGIGAFYNGLLHPLLVPAHALLIMGIGLVLGRHAPGPESRIGWPTFVVAAICSLVAGFGWGTTFPTALMIVIALIAASLVVLGLPASAPASAILAGIAGIAIGLSSSADLAGNATSGSWLTLTGIAVGTILWTTYIGGLSARSHRPWHRIAIRVVASWVMAVCLIVLALWSVHGTTA